MGRIARAGGLDAGAGTLLVHALYVSDRDLATLDPTRHVIGYCPWSQVHFAFPGHLPSWRAAGLTVALGTDCGACNDTMNVQQDLRAVGGGLAFATTWGAAHRRLRSEHHLDAARDLARARQVTFGQRAPVAEPAALLEMVWGIPGHLHPALPLGRIAPGYHANLAVWDLDHPAFWPGDAPLRALAYGDPSGALYGMMVSGRWVGRLGDLCGSVRQSAAYREALTEATDRWTRLRARIGL